MKTCEAAKKADEEAMKKCEAAKKAEEEAKTAMRDALLRAKKAEAVAKGALEEMDEEIPSQVFLLPSPLAYLQIDSIVKSTKSSPSQVADLRTRGLLQAPGGRRLAPRGALLLNSS